MVVMNGTRPSRLSSCTFPPELRSHALSVISYFSYCQVVNITSFFQLRCKGDDINTPNDTWGTEALKQ